MRAATEELVARYYAAFNERDAAGMLACLAEDVVHDVNQGETRKGKALFAAFIAHMDRCYSEALRNIVVLSSPDGARAAAEFVVHGTYLSTEEGLPPASGQSYVLPAGAFFEVRGGLITRVTTYYNLNDWMAQVVG
ncbi:MAG: nuclear transport factor 2 family protein [Alphaproteobacteria bacterium]|nr:nuclear transport factor 2 family protein [Alphaproteobacteria bacterium]